MFLIYTLRSMSARLHGMFGSRSLLRCLCMIFACMISLGMGFLAGSSGRDVSSGQQVMTGGRSPGAAPLGGLPSIAFSIDDSFPSGTDQAVLGRSAKLDAKSVSTRDVSTSRHAELPGTLVGGGSDFSSNQQRAAVSDPSISVEPERPVIQVPLIYQNVNPALVGLSSAQVAGIDKMRNEFNAQVGTPSSSSDPQYAQAWASAQSIMDEKLRTFLGWQQFNLYQVNAAKKR